MAEIMKRKVWEKCGGCCGGMMCDSYDPYKPDPKPDYATFMNIRTGKYYCPACLFQEVEFDKQVSETIMAYRRQWE